MGSANFSAQYQQTPIPVSGNLVKREWLRRYAVLPSERPASVVQSWDTASKGGELNDYSVCTTWHVHGKDYYLVDVLRARMDYPTLRRRVVELAKLHQSDSILIEDAASGTSLIQDLQSAHEVRPIAIKPDRDKITRLSTESAKIEAGQVFLPDNAPWLDVFVSELLAFPEGKYDDQVDSISQFLGWIENRGTFQILHVRI